MKPCTQTPCEVAGQPRIGNLFALIAVLLIIAASMTLTSCIGYSSAAPSSASSGELTPNSTSLSFGNVPVGTTGTQTISLTNTGKEAVNVSQIVISGTGFELLSTASTVSIPAGQSASWRVQFAPNSGSDTTGSLTVTSDASNRHLGIKLAGTGTQASMKMSVESVNFSNVQVGQTSSQNVTLTNSGNSNLKINSARVFGSGFGMSGLSFPSNIGAGQSATFSVQFTPTSTTGATGSITFNDNAGTSPQSLTLTGSALSSGSTLAAYPGSLSFANIAVGNSSAQTVTLTNSGSAAITINQVSTTGSDFRTSGISAGQTIAAGKTASFSASYAPTTSTTVSGSITIASTATNGALSVPLVGTATQGALSASPSSVGFGSVAVNSSASTTVTLSNTGTAAVSISGGSISGSGFSMGTLAAQTLNPGQSASFSVKFAPTAAVGASGSISVSSSAPGSPLAIALSGTGAQAQLSASTLSVSFGTVSVGNSNSQPITFTNSGNATLTFSQVSVSGTGFSETGLSTASSIAAGGSLTFNAAFTPASSAPASGSITLATNGTPSSLVIGLSGSGSASTLSLGASPTSLSFGSLAAGSTTSLTTSVTNTGNSNVTISSVTTTGAGFTASGLSSGMTLTPGQSVLLTVTFAPTSDAAVSGAGVTIASNATNSPTVISLSGSGSRSIVLSWSPSSTAGVGYNVYRGVVSGGEGATPINVSALSVTSFTDANVTSGQTYYYVVEAIDSSGVSGNSNEVSVAVPQ